MNHKKLIERLRKAWKTSTENSLLITNAADAIESLLAENERLKAEHSKYRDAPVVAWCHYDYAEETADYLQHFKDTYASIPLIVKPGE